MTKEKLKTLKDLEEILKKTCPTYDEFIHNAALMAIGVTMKTLKAEAVKWVKEFFPINKKGYQFTLGDFMKFHNITEEDLK